MPKSPLQITTQEINEIKEAKGFFMNNGYADVSQWKSIDAFYEKWSNWPLPKYFCEHFPTHDWPVKPYFDVDILESGALREGLKIQYVIAYRKAFRDYFNVTDSDIQIEHGCGWGDKEHTTTKYSFHFRISQIGSTTVAEMKGIATDFNQFLKENTGEYGLISGFGVDVKVYGKKQNIRFVESSKVATETKWADPERVFEPYVLEGQDYPTFDTFFTTDHGDKRYTWKPKCSQQLKRPIKIGFKKLELTSEQQESYLQLLKDSAYWSDVLHVVESTTDHISLQANAPYECKLCQRSHVKNTNRPVIYKNASGVTFHCRDKSAFLQKSDDLPKGKCLLDERKPKLTKIDPYTCNSIEEVKEQITYLNQYLIWYSGGDKVIIIELNYLRKPIFTLRSLRNTKDHMLPISSAFNKWCSSAAKRQIDELTYIPYTITPPTLNEKTQFNLFTGFLHEYDPNFIVSMEFVQPWLDHIKSVWANHDEIIGEYIINWFANKVQKPHLKNCTTIIIKSLLEGAGKNIVTDNIAANVLGNQFCRETSDLDRVLSKFNADAEYTVICVLDEIGTKGAAWAQNDKLKAVITRQRQPIEPKGKDARMAPDYNDYVLFTNNNYIAKVSESDRRHMASEGSNEFVGNHNYFKGLLSLSNQASGKHLFHYFCKRDITDFNPQVLPVSDWKRELKEKVYTPIVRALINYGNRHVGDDYTTIWVNDLFEEYEAIDHYGAKYDRANFSKQIIKVLNMPTTRIRKGEIQRSAFYLSQQQLLDRVRTILVDKGFQFKQEACGECEECEDGQIPKGTCLLDNPT
jgi:hypothetical protein